MYYYIYDSFLNEKKHLEALHRIEARLMNLGVNGHIEKLTILKSFKEIVTEAYRRGATTIVAVGNDETISKIISFLPSLSVTLGIIPVGPRNHIAEILGIPEGEKACETLSARIIEKIDLGKANDAYFISSLHIPAQKEIVVDCGAYHISSLTEDGDIHIYNFNERGHESGNGKHAFSPQDGVLEAVFSGTVRREGIFSVFRKKFSHESVFPFKKLKIKCSNECLPVVADGQTTIKTPVTVEVAPQKLKVIVGRNRMF